VRMSNNSTPECPTCGRDDFSSTNAMRTHHTITHGESLTKKTYTCDWCGCDFERQQSNVRSDKTFCSRECDAKWRGTRTGEDSPSWRGGAVEVECDWCGELIQRLPSRANRNERNFCCDKNCRSEWMSEEYSDEGHPLWTREQRPCDWCGERIEVPKAEREKYDYHFCGLECRSKHHSGEFAGEEHPNWEGGEEPYGEGWNPRKKRQVRVRDQARCQHCGRTESEHIEQYGSKHAVHHIIPARKIAKAERRNAMENLVTLCRGDCHHRWEKMAPLRPETATHH